MGSRYITKCFKYKNKFTMLLVEEYFSAWSAITAKMHVTLTPLGAFYSVIRIAYACIVLIRLYLTLVFFNIRIFQGLKNLWFLCKIKLSTQKKEIDDYIKLDFSPSAAFQTNQSTYFNFSNAV
ncbi:hypothetical protein BpHYR1_005461 [Brachionus plicatilis]|uniref:Uncharacterized protein n=1 Tax=Brachionus plicatilis TaxID=10195 RepID=A0A3M7S2R6_BRAPC|nr:hypothetical protein BpHYR1_005461 [Brachionus plicatilis]